MMRPRNAEFPIRGLGMELQVRTAETHSGNGAVGFDAFNQSRDAW